MCVPGEQPLSWTERKTPPSTFTFVPSIASAARVSSSNCETEAILANASPRNPKVLIFPRSSIRFTLLVAWRSKARSASSRAMPVPLSETRMSRLPPARISTRMLVLPASRAFSMSSLTTDAGRSTTSPAAILFATSAESILIFGIFVVPHREGSPTGKTSGVKCCCSVHLTDNSDTNASV